VVELRRILNTSARWRGERKTASQERRSFRGFRREETRELAESAIVIERPAMNFNCLRGIAEQWVVSDCVEQADAIVVLGGALDIRPAAAANLYKQRTAPLVLVPKSEADNGREARRMRERLRACGVPSDAISDFTIKLHSTYGEACGVAQFAEINRIKQVVVPVEIFQTRRVRWIFRRKLSEIGIDASVIALTPPDYNTGNWWRSATGRANFRSELIKLIYYRFNY
jgi:hypothetical protein